MNRILKRLLILASVFAFLAFLVFGLWSWANQPVCQSDCQSTIFVVQKGEGLSSISKRLQKEGLIKNSYLFYFLVSKENLGKKIQAGSFRLNSNMTPLKIAQEMTHGTLDHWVTLLEGWRREEVAEKLEEELGNENFNKKEFLQLTAVLEGRLFPDTYLIPENADASRVVAVLTHNFDKKTAALRIDRDDLILASIVEREAKFDADRPMVAGVLTNRIKIGMALQTDAAVQYALATSRCSQTSPCADWWPGVITRQDLEIKSPFNTYLNQGLPPAPISNPGLAAMKAAISPSDTDYIYYLSDKDGKMHYARTLDEHNANVARYIQK